MNEYEQQAKTFCEKNKVTIKVATSSIQSSPLWCKEWDEHGIKYDVTITRENKKHFAFAFWSSIHNKQELERINAPFEFGMNRRYIRPEQKAIERTKYTPNEYDILASLTKYDPETFQDFCNEFWYDMDSIKAKETFEGVDKEWHQTNRMFSDCLEELREIN